MSTSNRVTNVVKAYILPGGAVSAVLSYAANESALWSIFHMFTGWLYTIYWCCVHSVIPDIIRDKWMVYT